MKSHHNQPSLLILEDNTIVADQLAKFAKRVGFSPVIVAPDKTSGLSEWKTHRGFDATVIDLRLPEKGDGLQFLRNLNPTLYARSSLNCFYTGFDADIDEQLAALAPPKTWKLFRKPAQEKDLRACLSDFAAQFNRPSLRPAVRNSKWDRDFLELRSWIARTDLPILITGPSGAGKENVAQELARDSGRPPELTCAINCAAFSESLLTSELFGHVKDAFTGANKHRLGLILSASGYAPRADHKNLPFAQWVQGESSTAANNERCFRPKGNNCTGGTLILDEVAELSPTAQAALLRVLDGLPIKPIGYDGPGFLPRLRVIAITNDIKKLDSNFRPDLIHRLNGWHIKVEGLENRKENVAEIVTRTARDFTTIDAGGNFIQHGLTIDAAAMAALEAQTPKLDGGVRSLIWLAKRACVVALANSSKVISAGDIKAALGNSFLLTATQKGAGASTNQDEGGAALSVETITAKLHTLLPGLPSPLRPDDFRKTLKAMHPPERQAIRKELDVLRGDQSNPEQVANFMAAVKYTGRGGQKDVQKFMATFRSWM